MASTIDTRNPRNPVGPERGQVRRVPGSAGRYGPRATGAEDEDAGAIEAEAASAQFDWEHYTPTVSRRAQPAALLFAMIERMGGMPSSRWKGMYVNLVI